MPKKGRGKFRRYIRGNVDEQLGLGTLASRTLVATAFDETVQDRCYVSSLIASWAMRQLTPALGQGPIMVGVAHSDYVASEIEEFIENTGSWSEGDLVSQEIGKRKIRIIGIFQSEGDATAPTMATLQDGKKIRTRLGWILNQGQTLDLWAYNLGTASLATTVPEIQLQGHINLWPQ